MTAHACVFVFVCDPGDLACPAAAGRRPGCAAQMTPGLENHPPAVSHCPSVLVHSVDVCPCGSGDTRDIYGALYASHDLGHEIRSEGRVVGGGAT